MTNKSTAKVQLGDTVSGDVARKLAMPQINAAVTLQKWQADNYEIDAINARVKELSAQVTLVNAGNLNRAEEMLLSQAHTLDEIFNNLARLAHSNIQARFIPSAESFLRLALKSQSQCRATLETLAAIKNPPIVYARQANIANGPQQINNGVPTHAREIENQQSKLSGIGNELSSDTRTPALAGGVNQGMEAVGKIDRAEVKGG